MTAILKKKNFLVDRVPYISSLLFLLISRNSLADITNRLSLPLTNPAGQSGQCVVQCQCRLQDTQHHVPGVLGQALPSYHRSRLDAVIR